MQADEFDVLIVGAGVAGSFYALRLQEAGLRCLLVEAGRSFGRHEYPRTERDGSAELYWGGGIELDADVRLGLLRGKAVGGGSVVNQALLDRFDAEAWRGFREASSIADFTAETMDAHYAFAESVVGSRTIPREAWNGNAHFFAESLHRAGYRTAPLQRAQRDCRWKDGNDCIACLNGCAAGSKQSMAETALPRALAAGLTLLSELEADSFLEKADGVELRAKRRDGTQHCFRGKRIVLAAGPLGNIPLLARSGWRKKLPALGQRFFCHPQFMTFGTFARELDPHRGPFQALKSDEPRFRTSGFKLENVFAPLAAMAMLLPVPARRLVATMHQWRRFGCIEVAVRDATPGRVRVDDRGRVVVQRPMRSSDRKRRDAGLALVRHLFHSQGVQKLYEGTMGIGLHLMGGCGMGVDAAKSVVDPLGRVHGSRRVYVGDGSAFPDAPGINPSLSIMALASRNAATVLADATRGA